MGYIFLQTLIFFHSAPPQEGWIFFTACLSVYKTPRQKPESLKARSSSLAFKPQCAFIIHFVP